MVVLAIPVNYVWDFVVEGTATAMGWRTGDPGTGGGARLCRVAIPGWTTAEWDCPDSDRVGLGSRRSGASTTWNGSVA